MNGNGIIEYGNYIKYEGNFNDDKIEGNGKMEIKNGNFYDGIWKTTFLNNFDRNGKGKIIYKNGNKYEGEWKDLKRNGKGKIYFKNGGIYESTWFNDIINENGIMTYNNGDIYEGEWDIDIKTISIKEINKIWESKFNIDINNINSEKQIYIKENFDKIINYIYENTNNEIDYINDNIYEIFKKFIPFSVKKIFSWYLIIREELKKMKEEDYKHFFYFFYNDNYKNINEEIIKYEEIDEIDDYFYPFFIIKNEHSKEII